MCEPSLLSPLVYPARASLRTRVLTAHAQQARRGVCAPASRCQRWCGGSIDVPLAWVPLNTLESIHFSSPLVLETRVSAVVSWPHGLPIFMRKSFIRPRGLVIFLFHVASSSGRPLVCLFCLTACMCWEACVTTIVRAIGGSRDLVKVPVRLLTVSFFSRERSFYIFR